jgi:hypothetical protein
MSFVEDVLAVAGDEGDDVVEEVLCVVSAELGRVPPTARIPDWKMSTLTVLVRPPISGRARPVSVVGVPVFCHARRRVSARA